ncbi:MAG: hypothetical protein K2L34_08075 [Muribaculaceae bacterium]|nr:hypothetical protein [Muribaculaceae bacterium]
MTQITINVENQSIIPHLKKILNAIEGVSIAPTKKLGKSGIEQSYDDLKAGRVTRFETPEQLYEKFGI